jgi:hypothetical protein
MVGEISLEIRSVASNLDECDIRIQNDNYFFKSEIQNLNSEFGNVRAKINNNEANQTPSAVCNFPWSSAVISLIDVSQLTSQLSPAVSEPGGHISPSVNCVSATYLQEMMQTTLTLLLLYVIKF